MKEMRLICILLLFSYSCLAQNINYYYEDLYSGGTNPNYFSEEVIELIEALRESPIPLIDNSPEEISTVPTISLSDAEKILKYIEEHEIISYSTMCEYLNFTATQEILLTSCTTIRESKYQYYKPILKTRTRNMHYLSPIYGIEENKFTGSPLNLYNRVQFKKNNFSANFLTDKDTGEKNLADFMSANFAYSNDDWKIVIGDYRLDIGMGNILWRAMGMSKSSNTIASTIQIGKGIGEYKSSMDHHFFRGIASSHIFNINDDNQIKLSAWLSSTNRNATIDTNDFTASSIYNTGYYRTETEILKKESLNEKTVGGELRYDSDNSILGISSIYFYYYYPIESNSSSAFQGQEGTYLTAYYNHLFDKLTIFTEISKDVKNNIASKVAYQCYLDKFKIAGHFRYFPEEYRSPYGYNFGEFSYPANETGLYTGLFFKPTKFWEESIYIDLYKSNGPTYFIPEKSYGYDIFSESLFKLQGKNKVLVRLKTENKTASKTIEDTKQIFYKNRSSIRLEWRKEFANDSYIRIRGEACYINFDDVVENETGLVVFAEAGKKVFKPLYLSGRIVYFDTDSYDSAIWTYEYMMPGYMYTPGLYIKGIRAYISAKINIYKKVNIHARYSITYKPEVEYMGSSYNKILDNKDQRVCIQLDMAF